MRVRAALHHHRRFIKRRRHNTLSHHLTGDIISIELHLSRQFAISDIHISINSLQQQSHCNGEKACKRAENSERTPFKSAPAVNPSVPGVFAIDQISQHYIGRINHRTNLHAFLREVSKLVS